MTADPVDDRGVEPRTQTKRNIAAIGMAVLSVVLGLLAHRFDRFPGDAMVNTFVGRLGDGFGPIAFVFNERAWEISIATVALLAAALVTRRRYNALTFVANVLLLRAGLNLPKAAVGRPRPVGEFPIRDIATDSSFPSGHTMTAVMVFGLVFLFAPQLASPKAAIMLRATAIACIVLTAISRMWAGVHWFSDTWGACVWATAAILVILAAWPALTSLAQRARRSRTN